MSVWIVRRECLLDALTYNHTAVQTQEPLEPSLALYRAQTPGRAPQRVATDQLGVKRFEIFLHSR